ALPPACSLFLFNSPATSTLYTLSLHDALPISRPAVRVSWCDSSGCRWRSRYSSSCHGLHSGRPARTAEAAEEALTAHPHSYDDRSEEHTSELQSRGHLVCRLLLEKKKKQQQEE